VLISFFTRLFFQFAFLPKTPSEYGPDEGTYAALAKYVAEGLPVQEFPTYGPGLYNSARSLILPSSTFIRIGMNELLAVRLTSTLAGLLSLIMLSLCIIAIQNLPKDKNSFETPKLNYGQRLILIIFAFLPSNFLWSNLGLRESSSQFYLIAFTYFSLKLLSPKVNRKSLYSILSSISLILAFGTRPQTAMVFSLLAFVFSLILIWKLREFWILLAILVGFTFGQLFTVTPTLETTESLIAIKISNSESKPPAPSQSGEGKSPAPSQSGEGKSPAPSQSVESKSPAPSQSVESKPPAPSQSVESKSPAPAVTENLQEITELCLKDGQILIGKSGNYECTKSKEYKVIERSAIESARQQVLTTQILEIKRNVNRLDAASALPESTCRVSIWKIPSKILCEIIELPYRLPTFLFRPFPLIDSGSSFLNLAGIENLLWLGLVLYAAFAAFKMNLNKMEKFTIAWLYTYIITFSTAASLYEGNLGTAFRHKSSILWALALGLLISHKDFKIRGRDSKLFQYGHSKKEEN
jgi:hypothetical protein